MINRRRWLWKILSIKNRESFKINRASLARDIKITCGQKNMLWPRTNWKESGYSNREKRVVIPVGWRISKIIILPDDIYVGKSSEARLGICRPKGGKCHSQFVSCLRCNQWAVGFFSRNFGLHGACSGKRNVTTCKMQKLDVFLCFFFFVLFGCTY